MLIPPPDPCRTAQKANLSNNKNVWITISNNMGKPVYQSKMQQDAIKIPSNLFRSGIYMVTYQNGNEIIEGKFVIE